MHGVVCCLATLSQRLIYLNNHEEPGVVVLQDMYTTILFSYYEKVSFDLRQLSCPSQQLLRVCLCMRVLNELVLSDTRDHHTSQTDYPVPTRPTSEVCY